MTKKTKKTLGLFSEPEFNPESRNVLYLLVMALRRQPECHQVSRRVGMNRGAGRSMVLDGIWQLEDCPDPAVLGDPSCKEKEFIDRIRESIRGTSDIAKHLRAMEDGELCKLLERLRYSRSRDIKAGKTVYMPYFGGKDVPCKEDLAAMMAAGVHGTLDQSVSKTIGENTGRVARRIGKRGFRRDQRSTKVKEQGIDIIKE